jgi:hypothetical protein
MEEDGEWIVGGSKVVQHSERGGCDYADCSKKQKSLLERTISRLAPGTAAFVDYEDIEMI